MVNHSSVSLSIVGGWSYKYLSLESDDSLLFSPGFTTNAVAPLASIDGRPANVSIGPMVSITLPHNFHMFYELKYGKGYFENAESSNDVKGSGDEKARAIGAGESWTSPDKEWLLLLRAWDQQTRHVDTFFGDL